MDKYPTCTIGKCKVVGGQKNEHKYNAIGRRYQSTH